MMTAEQLRAVQAPLKARYKEDASAAQLVLHARGTIDRGDLTCEVRTGLGPARAGLHPAAGGDGSGLCSGEMLLEALVACAGVTLGAVATALGITLRGGTVSAEGELDFRGTLGVNKEVPVGFKAIRLAFDLDSDATPEQAESLLKLTERYCVVYQTLKSPVSLSATLRAGEGTALGPAGS